MTIRSFDKIKDQRSKAQQLKSWREAHGLGNQAGNQGPRTIQPAGKVKSLNGKSIRH